MNKKNKILAIYGNKDINSLYPEISHDHSIAFYCDGKLEKYIQIERISRKKHDNSLEMNLYTLLKSEKLINIDKETQVVFVDNILGRAFINGEGNIRFEGPINRGLSNRVEKGFCWWLTQNINAFTLNHELAHIYSCVPYYGEFLENSLLVHFDGGASKSNFSAWKTYKGKIEKIEYHWKLKYLSTFFNANALTFSVLHGNKQNQLSIPGKLMGFASFGKYVISLEEWLKENNFFENIWSDKKLFFEKAKKFNGYNKSYFDQHDPFIQDIMATIHHIFQRDFISYLLQLRQQTKTDYLYYSGGSALNIKTNTDILKSNIFKDVFIPPCCNDSGLSVGAGAFMCIKSGFKVINVSPYNNNWNILNSENYTYHNETINNTAQLLLEKKIIGICNGFGEIGPRAFGNRSILALANSKELAKKVSMQIKKREWYRPLAPIMLEKNAKYFTAKDKINHLSKYMLIDFEIIRKYRREIEGVVHVDGTSRIQVLFNRTDNPFMFDLLNILNDTYNVRALINTSFNLSGEPMVHTFNDAILSTKKMGLDALIYNGKLYYDIN